MYPLEVLRISTVVDYFAEDYGFLPLEVLRISTVVDVSALASYSATFGSAKNFYCCRFLDVASVQIAFGSAKNFYCCRWRITLFRAKSFGSAKNFYCCRSSFSAVLDSALWKC